MRRVQRSPRAKLDLLDIHHFITEQSQSRRVANDYLLKIDQVFDLLTTQPRMGRSRDELSPGLRSHPYENYLIFYRPIDSGIEVVRVLHAARDINAMFH